jgi:ABC-type nitrate/sulfonate/bicarbonate transport system substrate-binding protein
VGAGGVLLLAAAVVGSVLGWRAVERRLLLTLVRRREAVDAARQALEDVVMRLAEGSDETLNHFAEDPDAMERRTLHEVTSRARILADELDSMPLPKKLIPAADALGGVAYAIEQEAGKVRDEQIGDVVFEALGAIDLTAIAGKYAAATLEVQNACTECGLEEDPAVYGGGLYL